ncbi:MAG: glycosyltransferase [Patulibacter sp.]|nr:glycosyltransferase [Patulibacter sp.]
MPRRLTTALRTRLHAAEPSRPARITCVLGDLDRGGVSRVYSDLGAVLVGRGVVVRIIAPDGPMRSEIVERGIEWEPIDWDASCVASAEHAAALLRPREPTVLVGDPRSAHVLGLAAANGPTLCTMHSIPPLLAAWMGSRETHRMLRLLGSLGREGRVRTVTIGETYRRAYERRLGPDAGPVALLPPAIDGASFPFDPSPPGLDRVLCLSRLSPEKRPSLSAAVQLVAARRDHGHPCRLDVVGDGVWRREAEALCAASLPADAFRFHGATDRPVEAIQRAGVTVGTGLTVLEAIATGSRVVYARTNLDDAGTLGPALTMARFPDAAADAFGGEIGRSTPDEVWRDLEATDATERARLREHVLTAHSPDAAADALVEIVGQVGPVDPSPELRALAMQIAQYGDERADRERIAEEIWRARATLEAEIAQRRAAIAGADG